MSFYDTIQSWFEKALDNHWLYYATLIIAILSFCFIVGGAIYLFIEARQTPQAPDPERVFIEGNALAYCSSIGFNGWEFINISINNQFRCKQVENETKGIEEYLNMT